MQLDIVAYIYIYIQKLHVVTEQVWQKWFLWLTLDSEYLEQLCGIQSYR